MRVNLEESVAAGLDLSKIIKRIDLNRITTQLEDQIIEEFTDIIDIKWWFDYGMEDINELVSKKIYETLDENLKLTIKVGTNDK
jgi:hypothetical protein